VLKFLFGLRHDFLQPDLAARLVRRVENETHPAA
jgi:hypothetical protein